MAAGGEIGSGGGQRAGHLSPGARRKWFDVWRGGITAVKAVSDGFADAAGPGSAIVAADAMPSNRRGAGLRADLPVTHLASAAHRDPS
jgi:hypothetical protein